MLANFLIGLREGLEAALVVVILITALVRLDRRDLIPHVWIGVGAAVLISLLFGALLTFGPQSLTFEAQEAIGGTLSIVAVGFVTWMIFWMAHSARTLSSDLREKVALGVRRKRGLVLVAVLGVGREGLETALFLWAATKAAARDNGSTTAPLAGAALGLGTAALLGWLFYRGAVRIDLGRFFAWTGAFLVLIAAGVLSYGVHDLQEAGILPGLNAIAFDVSHVIDPNTVLGTLLKGVFNFSPRTTWLEAIAWTLYAVPVLVLFRRALRRRAPRPQPRPALERSAA